MPNNKDWELIVNTLTGKGYEGYFLYRGEFPKKLKEIIAEFAERTIKDGALAKDEIWLSTYLLWNGEDKPNVSCDMWMQIKEGKIVIDKMIIEKNHGYGAPLRSYELNNLLLEAIPTKRHAIELVNERKINKASQEKKGKLRL